MGDYKRYYKIGSRWDLTGAPQNCIAHIFDRYQAIFLGEDKIKANPRFKEDVFIDEIIAIADGEKLVGIAIVKSSFKTLKEMNIHDKLKMDHGNFIHIKYENEKEHPSWAKGYKAKVVLFKDEDDKIKYNQGAFHAIDSVEAIKHIDEMIKKYNIIIK